MLFIGVIYGIGALMMLIVLIKRNREFDFESLDCMILSSLVLLFALISLYAFIFKCT